MIDADIIGKAKHRFPNLCCMKLSSYHKWLGDDVELKTDYEGLGVYDRVYISKVFTDTEVPGEPEDKSGKDCFSISEWYADNAFLQQENIVYGGTGFFYDKAPPLPDYIEHAKPDYHLYDGWVREKIDAGFRRKEFQYYTDYSIGFLTRRCFRGCNFCVNRNYKRAICASSLKEFIDWSRPKLCFLDDNFFSHPNWRELIAPVVASGKRFQFRQGLDERLLTAEHLEEIKKWNYDGSMTFAFDNIEDKPMIVAKLKLLQAAFPNPTYKPKFYVFCGFDRNGVFDDDFWRKDIRDLFERIYTLSKYGALPYVMRFEKVYKTEYATFYSAIAGWCNQPQFFLPCTFRQFCQYAGMRQNGYKKYKRDVDAYLKNIGIKGSQWRAMEEIEARFPEIARQYYDFAGRSVRQEAENVSAAS